MTKSIEMGYYALHFYCLCVFTASKHEFQLLPETTVSGQHAGSALLDDRCAADATCSAELGVRDLRREQHRVLLAERQAEDHVEEPQRDVLQGDCKADSDGVLPDELQQH